MNKPDTSADELPDELMKSLGFEWDSFQHEYRNDGRKQFDRDYDDSISLDLAKQLTSYTKQRELALLERLEQNVSNLPTWESSSMVEGEDVFAAIQKEKEKLV